MPIPSLQPDSTTTAVRLPETGTIGDVAAAIPNCPYIGQAAFLSGAAAQVNFMYLRMAGNILDIELKPKNVYEAYCSAVLKYSEIINSHHASNVLSDFLGTATGTFDHLGEFKSGDILSASLSGTNPALVYPRFTFSYSARIADGFAEASGLAGSKTHFSASFIPNGNDQEYDLQEIVRDLATASGSNEKFVDDYNNATNKRINIERVYYVSPTNFWRFYGYYGGLSVVGNLNTYGQYSDDSTFELVPAWQNKLQALAFETNLYTRASHYSYEVKNNKLKLFPPPTEFASNSTFRKIWFEFTFSSDPFDDPNDELGVKGVNNFSTLPFTNINFCNINSMGKDWIRWYALALAKESLAYVRGKFTTLPIPGNEVTLNWNELLTRSKEEQEGLITSLKELLDTLTYQRLVEVDAEMADNSNRIQEKIPTAIFVG